MKTPKEIMEWLDPDNEVSRELKIDLIVELLLDIRTLLGGKV